MPPPHRSRVSVSLAMQLLSTNRQNLLLILWLKRQLKFPFPIYYHCIIYTIHQLNGHASKERGKRPLVFRAHTSHQAAGL